MGRKKSGTIKTPGKKVRLQWARQWILTHDGTKKHIVKNYRKKFSVEITTAIRDLQEIGVEFPQEYVDAMKRSEEDRIRQKRLRKEKRAQQEQDFWHKDSDDVFAFIAGYTGGGAPYGITWEELGIEPYASYEELMEAYGRMDRQREADIPDEDEFWEEYPAL